MAAEAGIPLLDAEVEQRVAFAESLTMGKTIFEWSPTGAAAKEITTLTDEIVQHVQEKLRSSAATQAARA